MALPSRTPARRPTSSSSPAASTSPPKAKVTQPPSIISKGATARSAVPLRASPSAGGHTRRSSASGISPRSSPVPNGDVHVNGREALVASLKRETDEKEELLVRLQEKDAQIAALTSEAVNVNSSLSAAETRLSELYADQTRMEDDMAARLEVTEKLRVQVRDLEREKRETLRRYTEQTATFEAERQAFYDNEQHLKSRIQSLMASKKAQQEAAERPSSPVPSITPSTRPSEIRPTSPKTSVAHFPSKEDDGDVSDGPEITALKMELSTLSTSHTSLQVMVQMLQTELADLKRVNNALQEENESYGLLLMERAMNGTGLDMLRQMGGDERSVREEAVSLEEEKGVAEEGERSSLRSVGRSTLGRVPEAEELVLDGGEPRQSQPTTPGSEYQDRDADIPHPSRRRRTRQTSVSPSPRGASRGESLADLPITGPGLDLAAELGRAETKDILGGNRPESVDHFATTDGRRSSRKPLDTDKEHGNEAKNGELEVLRQEVKSLKDANKALSLYASKIIDRIIMQEGFEHVLAVDFNADDRIPARRKSPGAFEGVLAKAQESPPAKPKARPQSMLLGRATSLKIGGPLSSKEGIFKFPSTTSTEPEKPATTVTQASPAPDAKRNRRSMSFDWKAFSMFGGSAAPSEKEKNLRPLTLKPGNNSALVGARKLETQEDEDDKKERERLNATMKLMGIEKPAPSNSVPLETPQPEPATPVASEVANPRPPLTSRFPFFRSKSTNSTLASSPSTVPTGPPPVNLTSEALEHAEAETTLASLDAREKVLTAEIAKGGSGGFTELRLEGRMSLGDEWRNRRTRSVSGKSHESSGASTVWSAGMKADEEEGEHSGL